MATTQGKLTVQVVLPWWWRPYMRAAQLVSFLGFPVDADREAAFIVRHTKFKLVKP